MSVTDVEREFLEGVLATEPGTHSIQDLRYAYYIAALDGTLPGGGGGGQEGMIVQGVGTPLGVVTASRGTLYVDTAATNGASVWRKASRTGSTGWVVVTGSTGWRDITGMIGPAWRTYLTGGAASRRVIISRVDGFVTLRVLVDAGDAIVGEPRSQSQEFLNLPTGFKNGGYTSVGYGRATPPSAIADFNTGGTIGMVRVFTMGESDSSAWASGHYITAEFTFKTDNAWPTTLPGIPA